jgi:hypothetical protein
VKERKREGVNIQTVKFPSNFLSSAMNIIKKYKSRKKFHYEEKKKLPSQIFTAASAERVRERLVMQSNGRREREV